MQAVLIMNTADQDKRILTLLLDALRGCELTATNLEAMAALVRATLRDVPLEFPDWINTKGER